MEYKGYLIEEDRTGYAPSHLKFSFFNDDGETCFGSGDSIEDCKKQIDDKIKFDTIRRSNYQQSFYDYNYPQ